MRPILAALLVALTARVSSPAEPAAVAPWRQVNERIGAGRTAFGARIAEVHKALKARLEAERPDLLKKLEPTPPAPLATGYGILPRIDFDNPATPGPPLEKSYALAELSDWLAREVGNTAALAAKLDFRVADLSALVDDYLLRAENFRRIDNHVGYHALWQDQGEKTALPRGMDLLAHYRTWQAPAKDDDAKAAAAAARKKLEDVVYAPFTPHGLHVGRNKKAACVLPVRLATDIDDEGFLRSFGWAVDKIWNDAEEMKRHNLRIELEWDRRDAAKLYPEGVPAYGAAIDLGKHLAHFKDANLIVSTGAGTTHVLGNGLLLGSAPLNAHTIAHEFGHLLGFWDEYTRVWEGSPTDPNGFIIRELILFPEGLMCSPGEGGITRPMVERVLAAYGG